MLCAGSGPVAGIVLNLVYLSILIKVLIVYVCLFLCNQSMCRFKGFLSYISMNYFSCAAFFQIVLLVKCLLLLLSLGPGPGHFPRLFSKTGLNFCLKRTRAEAVIPETPTTHHHRKLVKDQVLVLVIVVKLRSWSWSLF